MTKLYLDDKRQPSDSVARHGGLYSDSNWYIVRSKQSFIEFVSRQFPDVVSLDHDLNLSHYGGNYGDKETGHDCLVWLLDYCDILNIYPPVIHLHTANPDGKKRMKDYITGWEIGRKTFSNQLNQK